LLTVGSGIPYRAVENFQKIFHRPFSGRKSRWTFGWRTRVIDRGKATRYFDSAKQGLKINHSPQVFLNNKAKSFLI